MAGVRKWEVKERNSQSFVLIGADSSEFLFGNVDFEVSGTSRWRYTVGTYIHCLEA